ncbi:MAG: extracellular solute-binding protein [Pseudomonadota bacterium]
MDVSQFQDLLFSGKITRRQAKKLMGAFGIGTVAMPILSNGARAFNEDHPVFFTWAGYDSPEFMIHYVEKYGVEPNYTFFDDEDAAFNKMRAGYEPDIHFPCLTVLPLWNDAGLLAPIETDRLSNWPDVIPSFKDLPGSVVDGKRLFVPEDWGQTSIMVRGDLAPEYADPANQTWNALWDENYAGRVSMIDYSTEASSIAAVILGLDPWNLSDDDLAKVHQKLKEQLPLNRLLGSSMTEIAQSMASGEIIMAVGWNSLIWNAQEADPEAQWIWMNPKEGAFTWVCGLCIHPAAIEHGMYEKAHEVIDSFISPEAGIFEIENWYYGHANVKAYEPFTDEFLRSIGLAKDVDAYLASTQFYRYQANVDKIAVMWEEVKAGV